MLELLERTSTDYVAIHGAEFSAGCTNVREVEVSIAPKDPEDSQHTIQIQLQHDESITGTFGMGFDFKDRVEKSFLHVQAQIHPRVQKHIYIDSLYHIVNS